MTHTQKNYNTINNNNILLTGNETTILSWNDHLKREE